MNCIIFEIPQNLTNRNTYQHWTLHIGNILYRINQNNILWIAENFDVKFIRTFIGWLVEMSVGHQVSGGFYEKSWAEQEQVVEQAECLAAFQFSSSLV